MNEKSYNDAKYSTIPGSDRPKMVENRKFTTSRKLFKIIAEYFPHSDFTKQDIKDSYNKYRDKTRFGQSHFNRLIKDGLLDYDDTTKTYSINHTNDEVAKRATDDADYSTKDERDEDA